MLVVGMTGVKMGERLAQFGCAHGGRLAAIAKRVGLSGRAAAIVPDEDSAERARKGAARAGVLVEVETTPLGQVPLEDSAFDVVVVDDTAGVFGSMRGGGRGGGGGGGLRVFRSGGRVLGVGSFDLTGYGAVLICADNLPPFGA